MKKIVVLIILIICFYYQAFSQQVSVTIPFGEKTGEYGWNISKVEDDFIITTQLRCKLDDDVPSEGCCAMVRINRKGEVIWKKLMEFETDFFSRPGFPSPYVVRSDSFIVSGILRKNDSIYLRLFIVQANGTLLRQIDTYHPQMDFNLGMLGVDDGYIVYNTLRDTTNEKLDYLFLKLDRAFNIVKELRFGKDYKTVYAGPCILLPEGNILCAMDEKYVLCCAKSILLIRMNTDLILESETEINFNTMDNQQTSPFIQVSKDSSLFIWHIKEFKIKPDTFPISPTLFKYNSLDQKLWEKSDRTYRSEIIQGSFNMSMDDFLYMSGSTSDVREKELAWFRKLDQEGNILWHRYYVDSTKKRIKQYFKSFVEDINGGFALTGLNQDTFPNHDPKEFNWDIWFVTLDKDGCFNGDCSDTIYLDQKLPNKAYNGGFRLDELLEFYPNPANEVVNIQFKNSIKRHLKVFDTNGKLMLEKELFTDGMQLQLGSLTTGNYHVRIEDDAGKWILMPLQVIH
ncbi:MAG: T9SS type A sorting domain-containing protein [Saprospiraceae bacterium]|jgi:hypothetical protein